MKFWFVHPELEVLKKLVNVRDLEDKLEELVEVMWDPPGVETLMLRVENETLMAYWSGDALVLLETVEWDVGRELLIYGFAGRGILKQGEAIMRDLKKIAEYKGCSLLGGLGVHKAWLRIRKTHGFKLVSNHYVMELDNGR